MKLLLKRNVPRLGIVGDVVNVSAGYARNYLLPHDLATEPTTANMRRLSEARKQAELERQQELARMAELAERVNGAEVTIVAKANEEGVLYGSVGRKDIAAALQAEGFAIDTDHVVLRNPIRHLDNIMVDLRLGEQHKAQVKVWVVRERTGTEAEETPAAEARTDEPVAQQ